MPLNLNAPSTSGLVEDLVTIAREFLRFLSVNKKYWLAPMVAQSGSFALFMLLSQGSNIASPFIYTLF
jgi:hypothetical protein